jgi:hypothetical protein
VPSSVAIGTTNRPFAWDADRFPELGRQYQKNFARGRTGILIAYLRSVARRNAWAKRDVVQDAALYEALLRAGIFEEALHGLLAVNSDTIEKHARSASNSNARSS